MENTTGKEGKGVKGTGFEGETGSNHYSQLPSSSNAAFGIDADIAAGVSNEHGEVAEGDSSMKGFGIDGSISDGTVPARRTDDFVNAGKSRGNFGVSAKTGGHASANPDSYYGSGARKEGTAAQYGQPGRGGSMAQAIKGLSGATGGGTPPDQKVGKDAAAATLQSKLDAGKGIKGSNATD